ncbi:hypothetical protein B0H15DRAFT_139202 [Mycena belliarum]|uniref:Secreted protein n=1 Tax=Mycena belliarum TaxID=1033014 RepID=A0AAD6TLN3_9AGAR|nr:hypothetical protein B0H15DRAFT_139202 [Mycena belliae]
MITYFYLFGAFLFVFSPARLNRDESAQRSRKINTEEAQPSLRILPLYSGPPAKKKKNSRSCVPTSAEGPSCATL